MTYDVEHVLGGKLPDLKIAISNEGVLPPPGSLLQYAKATYEVVLVKVLYKSFNAEAFILVADANESTVMAKAVGSIVSTLASAPAPVPSDPGTEHPDPRVLHPGPAPHIGAGVLRFPDIQADPPLVDPEEDPEKTSDLLPDSPYPPLNE